MKIESFEPADPEQMPEFLFYGISQTADEVNKVLNDHLVGTTIKSIAFKETSETEVLNKGTQPHFWLVIELANGTSFEVDVHNNNKWQKIERFGSLNGVIVNGKKAGGIFYMIREGYSLWPRVRYYILKALLRLKG